MALNWGKLIGAGGTLGGGGFTHIATCNDAGTTDSVSSIDISDTSALAFVDTELDGVGNGYYTQAINRTDNTVVFFDNTGDRARLYDFSDPANVVKTVTGSTESTFLDNVLGCHPLEESGYYYAVAYGNARLTILSSSSLAVVGSLALTNFTNPIAVAYYPAADVVYTCAYGGATRDVIQVVDVSTKSSPTEVATHTDSTNLLGGWHARIDETNEVLYITSYNTAKLCAYDISTPTSLTTLGAVTITGASSVRGLALDLDRQVAYVSHTATASVTSVDISNPASMSVLDTVQASASGNIYTLDYDPATKTVYGADNSNSCIYSFDVSNTSALAVSDTLTDTTKLKNVRSLSLFTE